MKKCLSYIFIMSLFLVGCSNKQQISLNERYMPKEGTEGFIPVIIEYGDALNLDVKKYLSNDVSEELLNNTQLEVYKVINDEGLTEEKPLEDTSQLDCGNYVIVLTESETILKVPFEIKDTIAPKFIDFKEQLETQEGSKFTLDGKFKATDLSKVKITFEGKVELTKPGKYPVKVIAIDEAGNKTEKECVVTVTQKPEESKKPSDNNTPSKQPSTGNKTPNKPSGGNSGNNNNSNNNNNNTTPAPQPKPEPKPEPQPKKEYVPAYAQQVLTIVNQERAKEGLAPLSWDPTLASAADVRAKEIVTLFDHTRPDGTDCFTAVNGSYSWMGENIAAGQPTPEAVMVSWMNSQGHHDNIMKPEYTLLGVSCYIDETSKYGIHWVQLFGSK